MQPERWCCISGWGPGHVEGAAGLRLRLTAAVSCSLSETVPHPGAPSASLLAGRACATVQPGLRVPQRLLKPLAAGSESGNSNHSALAADSEH
eukprot:1072442-Rhodomonas_salina.1